MDTAIQVGSGIVSLFMMSDSRIVGYLPPSGIVHAVLLNAPLHCISINQHVLPRKFSTTKNAQVCVFEPLDCLNIQGKKSELIKMSWGPPLFLVLLLKMIQVSEVDEPPEGPGAVGELDRVAPLIADPPPLKGRSP